MNKHDSLICQKAIPKALDQLSLIRTAKEEASNDPTDAPYRPGGSVDTNPLSDGTVRSTIQGIFVDLMLGVRAEEGLDRRIGALGRDMGGLCVGNEASPGKTDSSSARWLRELGKDLKDMDTSVQLAEVLAVLGELYLRCLAISVPVLTKIIGL